MESINNNTTISGDASPPMDSYREYKDFDGFAVFLAPLVTALFVFGMTTNAINVVVFSQLLSQDTTNISLLGMSVSDFLVCFTGALSSFCEWPVVQEFIVQHLNWHPFQFNYQFIAQPHMLIARTNLTIITFITLERCLCVAIPLKVRRILTPKVVKIIMILSYIIPLVLYSPILACTYIDKCFSPDLNRTINCYNIDMSTYSVIKRTYVPIAVWISYGVQFTLIIICTSFLIATLLKKSKWRTDASSSAPAARSNSKQKRVVKMMAMLSSMFIICNLPTAVIWMWHSIQKEFSSRGTMRNTVVLGGLVAYTMEATGASLNLFIYFKLSTKYKEMFGKLFTKFGKTAKTPSTVT